MHWKPFWSFWTLWLGVNTPERKNRFGFTLMQVSPTDQSGGRFRLRSGVSECNGDISTIEFCDGHPA